MPIFGPVVLAGFADVGTVFNRNKGGTQQINSNFLPDQPFLGASSINNVLLFKNIDNTTTAYQQNFFTGGIFLDKTGAVTGTVNNPVTKSQYTTFVNATCPLNSAGERECPTDFLTTNFSEVFLRGNAQTNTLIRVGDSQFSSFKNIAASLGLELRVQVPVVNVPFRLIYYYNPNVRTLDFNGVAVPLAKRSGFRFTVGRTF